jgi:methionyl-tRNA formyltransferase
VRVIYLGTPEFAVPTLKELIDAPDFDVVAAVCQPDRPKGRGNKVAAPPVKEVAAAADIQVLQPEKLSKAEDIVEAMKNMNPDVLVMVAFGQILKKPVLNLAPFGVINLHGSLLPHYRGAAPINWSIINGDTTTGITTMQTDVGVDSGDMLLKAEVDITEDMTAPELGEILSTVGAKLMLKTLRGLKDGSIKPEKQDDSLVTFAPILTKEMAAIDWNESARNIHNKVRGLLPWPGTITGFRDTTIKILKTKLVASVAESSESKPSGSIIVKDKHILVACGANGTDRLELIEVQPANRPKTKVSDWANGVHLLSEDKLEPALQRA